MIMNRQILNFLNRKKTWVVFYLMLLFCWANMFAKNSVNQLEPNAPEHFNVMSNSCNSVTFSWNDILGATEESYEIHRSEGNPAGPYHYIGSSPANNLVFTDHTIIPMNTYYYYVKGRFGFGFGKASQVIMVMPNCPDNAGEINNLRVYAKSCSQLVIQWDDIVGFNEENYELYRAKDHPNNQYEIIGLPHQNQTQWIDGNLNNNTKYYYLLKARFFDRFSNYSIVEGQTTLPLYLDIVSNCSNKVKLKWDICTSQRENWVIYATTDNESWKEIGRTDALVNTFEANLTQPTKHYYFAVQPIYSNGFSNWSNVVHRDPNQLNCNVNNTSNNMVENLAVYPNPATDNVNLKLLADEALEQGILTLVDLSGNVKQSLNLSKIMPNEEIKLNTSNLNTGGYRINILGNNGNKAFGGKLSISR
jgi:hypothetical protein